MGKEEACCGPVRDRAEQRRRRIIEAARKLFVTNGFHATGVAQIAKESEIAVGQLYRDFESKEDIVAAIVEGDCAAFMARESLHQAIAEGDAASVWAWLRTVIEPADAGDAEPLFAEIVAETARNERVAAIFGRKQQELVCNMRAALELLAPGAAIASRREVLADLIVSQSLGLMQQRLLRPGFDARALVDFIVTALAREIELLTMRSK